MLERGAGMTTEMADRQRDSVPHDAVFHADGARILDRRGDKRLPIGDDGFETVAERSVFIDKSMLIADVLDGDFAVTLFCRPRRFGKTLAMTMLKAFLELPPDGVSRAGLFEGLEIWDADGGRYRAEQGKRPVIYLTLNDVKKSTWEEAYASLTDKVAAEYERHAYLMESDRLSDVEKAQFGRLRTKSAPRAEVDSSLRQLSLYLAKHHGCRTVVLIDEFDAPIMAGYANGYYREMVDFTKGWLTGVLKDGGAALDFACMTGVQRISKESIFSDLNNVTVDTALGGESEERFGFTEHEVAALADYLGHPHRYQEVRDWYDGYRFGGVDIYNPWSVLNYFSRGCQPGVYWANTATNTPVGDAVRDLNGDALAGVYGLLEPGGVVRAPLDVEVTFPEGGVTGDELWSLLYLAGYLTTEDTQDPTDSVRLRPLRIPNKEVSLIFSREVIKRFRGLVGGAHRLEGLHAALVDGNAEGLRAELESVLLDCVAPVDLRSENSYHMLVLGLLFGVDGYAAPVSNGRAGRGFYDIRLNPLAPGKPTITLEFKVLPRHEVDRGAECDTGRGTERGADPELPSGRSAEDVLRETAREGLAQVRAKAYDHDAPGPRLRFGIAFYKQEVAVEAERAE